MMDIANLGGKRQIPGGDTIEQMRDSMQSNPRFEGRMLEAFLTDAGVQSVSNILQFYTADRRMALLGNDALTFADFDADKDSLVPEKHNKFSFWKNFPFTVVPGSMHGGAKDREKLMAIQLFSAGALSRKKLLEILEVTDIRCPLPCQATQCQTHQNDSGRAESSSPARCLTRRLSLVTVDTSHAVIALIVRAALLKRDVVVNLICDADQSTVNACKRSID
jgi:hypothetical protein